MRGEREMSDVVETTSDKDGGSEEDGGSAIILLFRRGRTPRWR